MLVSCDFQYSKTKTSAIYSKAGRYDLCHVIFTEKWKLRNVITLGLKEADNNNQVVKIVPFYFQYSKTTTSAIYSKAGA
jgi:hypothetical protein